MENKLFEEIKKFDKWMLNMKNIYYKDNKKMTNAYNRILI